MIGSLFGFELEFLAAAALGASFLLLLSSVLVCWPVNIWQASRFDVDDWMALAALFAGTALFASCLFQSWPFYVLPPAVLEHSIDFSGKNWTFVSWEKISSGESSWGISYEGYSVREGCVAMFVNSLAGEPPFFNQIVLASGDYADPSQAVFSLSPAQEPAFDNILNTVSYFPQKIRVLPKSGAQPSGEYFFLRAIAANRVSHEILSGLAIGNKTRIYCREVALVSSKKGLMVANWPDSGARTCLAYQVQVLDGKC